MTRIQFNITDLTVALPKEGGAVVIAPNGNKTVFNIAGHIMPPQKHLPDAGYDHLNPNAKRGKGTTLPPPSFIDLDI